MKIVFLSIILFLSIISCDSTNGASQKTGNDAEPLIQKSLSQMTLLEAARTKYSKLELICSHKITLIRETEEPSSVGPTRTIGHQKFVLFNILSSESESKSYSFNHDIENITTSYQIEMNISLIDKLNLSISNQNDFKKYEINNTIQVSLKVNRKYNDIGTDGLNFRQTGQRTDTAIENIPFFIVDESWSIPGEPNSTKINFDCVLDAEVKEPYKEDFKELN